ncbi:TIR domain-containing protein [bacterium]|nr:TIR domain-containing protein [bacterium]
MAHDVFISYSSGDRAVADAACAALESQGLRCWAAPRDILPGRDWGEAIIDAIDHCRVMVLVLSRFSNESGQVKREVQNAVASGVEVLPFRVEEIILSKTLRYFLGTQQWLDGFPPPLESHLPALADAVRAHLRRKAAEPADAVQDRPRAPRVEVVLTRRSVVDLGAEGIGYSANDHLLLGGGVAKALAAAAGPSLQAEAAAHVRQQGPVTPGCAVRTGPHGLASSGCKGILHLVVLKLDRARRAYLLPDEPARREELLRRAIASSVRDACRLAAAAGWSSLAFGLMGTRAARLAPEVSVSAMVSGLRSFLEGTDPSPAPIERVYFSYFTSENARRAFEAELRRPENAARFRLVPQP